MFTTYQRSVFHLACMLFNIAIVSSILYPIYGTKAFSFWSQYYYSVLLSYILLCSVCRYAGYNNSITIYPYILFLCSYLRQTFSPISAFTVWYLTGEVLIMFSKVSSIRIADRGEIL